MKRFCFRSTYGTNLSRKNSRFSRKPTENNSKVFIEDNESIEPHYPYTNNNKSYYSECKQVKMTGSNLRVAQPEPQIYINRKRGKEYVLLEERTKKLTDLKDQDLTVNREKEAPCVKRYENRRKRARNQRINVNEVARRLLGECALRCVCYNPEGLSTELYNSLSYLYD